MKAPRTVLPQKETPDSGPAFQNGFWILIAAAVVVLAGGGFFGYRFFTQHKAPNASATAAVAASAPKTAPATHNPQPPTPAPVPDAPSALKPGEPVVANPQSDLGKLVAKARDTVSAHDQSDAVRGMEEVLGDDSASKAASVAHVNPSGPLPAEDTLAARPVNRPPPPAPQPNVNFRAFVVNMRVNGVFQGTPSRALINGRMVHVGETVDSSLKIVLSDVDPERKLLIFKDASGAVMPRRY
jgi:hypothetical protein